MDSAEQKRERYQLNTPLGEGGQGRTFKATDTKTGFAVAVKVIQLKGSEGWKPFDLFERECQILRSLNHPSIPRYLDTFAHEEEGKYFLVMELIDGQSLKQGMEQKQLLPESQLWIILYQTLDILEYLHSLQPLVIHRDIKPANLIRRPDGKLSLVDFGGVRVALRKEGGSTVVGTFGYMAPEQLHGEATPATDIYGLGATLAALATGLEPDKLPRQGLSIDLNGLMEDSDLRRLLNKMLEPNPSRRLASVAAVRNAIRQPEDRSSSVDQDPAERGDLEEIDHPLSFVVRIVGSVGYVGLVLVDAMILPLIFGLLTMAWSSRPNRLNKLKQREETIRNAVGHGRRAMKTLAKGRDPYTLADRGQPHAFPPLSKRPRLPPRGRGEHGRGGGRGHGRRR